MKRKSRCSLCLLSICLVLPLSGCHVPAAGGPSETFGLDFRLPATSRANGIILFVADGLNAATFQDLLEAGQLPAIDKYFVKRGLYVPRAACGHPSLTMDNLMSLVTGLFPGHHGLPAAKWFDRNRLIFRNYETLRDKNKLDEDCTAESLYQQFPGRLTFSLFLQPHRGATYFFENRLSAGPAMAFGQYALVDRWALYRFGQAMSIARQYGQFPAVMTVYQLLVNFTAYEFGATSPQYRQSMREMDRQIGRVLGDLERSGMLGKVVLALVSDHGHCDTPQHGKIREYVEALGIPLAEAKPAGEDLSFEQRLDRFGRVAGVPYGPGDRYWALYLRKALPQGSGQILAPWLNKPSSQDLRSYPARKTRVDLPSLLADLPYVDATAYLAGPGRVRVVRKQGEVEFRRTTVGADAQATIGRQERITYRLIRGADPLEWAGIVPQPALDGEPLTSRQWLEVTARTEFPDLATGLLSYFDGALAADVVVFPAPGWDFDGWRKAGHGGIRADEVFAPMLLAGPGIPAGRIPVARTVDLTPTLLAATGTPIPEGLDGESLIGLVGR
jgi:hypothetical protein